MTDPRLQLPRPFARAGVDRGAPQFRFPDEVEGMTLHTLFHRTLAVPPTAAGPRPPTADGAWHLRTEGPHRRFSSDPTPIDSVPPAPSHYGGSSSARPFVRQKPMSLDLFPKVKPSSDHHTLSARRPLASNANSQDSVKVAVEPSRKGMLKPFMQDCTEDTVSVRPQLVSTLNEFDNPFPARRSSNGHKKRSIPIIVEDMWDMGSWGTAGPFTLLPDTRHRPQPPAQRGAGRVRSSTEQ